MSRIRKQRDVHTARFTLVLVGVIAVLMVLWIVIQLTKGGGGGFTPPAE